MKNTKEIKEIIARLIVPGLLLAILLPGRTVYAGTAADMPSEEFKTLSQVAMEALAEQKTVDAEQTTEKETAVEKTAETENVIENMASMEAHAEEVKSADTAADITASDTTAAEISLIPEENTAAAAPAAAENAWNGRKLSRKMGTVKGPSGKETYYNLNMRTIVNNIKSHGWIWQEIDPSLRQNVSGDYHIREDGCKMLGQYIMVAAHLGVHPRGSLVETTLGTGVVVDTGTFARSNAHQIDVAVNW